MTILVLNAGSSSLKWKLYVIEHAQCLASGVIEGIGEVKSHTFFSLNNTTFEDKKCITTHEEAFTQLFTQLEKQHVITLNAIDAVGHRVVHGGENFSEPTYINLETLEVLRSLNHLAPLHNPANILGIELILKLAPTLPNIAVFDTAFHHSMPQYAFRYGLPKELYQTHQIRRYGFHGTSHHYLATQTAKLLKQPIKTLSLITLHLGNGASACAIKNGQSVDTSMGFTPLEGLMMGTRSGDLDPAIVPYLMENLNLDVNAINTLLNKKSGLKGICDENDLRTIIKRAEQNDAEANLALAMFTYRIKKYIGAYVAVLGRVDAIVFSGGIGEHSPLIRSMVLEGLQESFGVILDVKRNLHMKTKKIHSDESRIKVFVIETNEELQIAHECANLLKKP